MPSALLHQQIALLELDLRLRDAERHHRLFRSADADRHERGLTRRAAHRAARRADRAVVDRAIVDRAVVDPFLTDAATPALTAAARVIDLPAAPTSMATAARGDQSSSPAKVA